MRIVEPEVFLVGRPSMDYDEVARYLHQIGGQAWLERQNWWSEDYEVGRSDAEALVELYGRLCYRSWEPGLNPNVTKVRTDSGEYLANILASLHGSVTEHATYNFVLHNVSRVETHEHVRHRAGTAISQESLRFVRLTDIPFWFPAWAQEDAELMDQARVFLARAERFQQWMAEHFGLDEPGVPFAEKKHKTSFMRRFAPEGVATGLGWSANVRTLRHVIETRTAEGAEEEIQLVVGKIARLMVREAPHLFGDYAEMDGVWTPRWRKV